jgi:DNA replication protein DnaD
LRDSPRWLEEKFTRGQAWVDLLMLTNHTDGQIRKRGVPVEVHRGEIGWSEEALAERWKWSRGKVRRFLAELSSKTVQQIEQQKTNVTSLIKVTNWDLYQSNGTPDNTASDTANGHQTDTKRYRKKNDKNEKNTKELPEWLDSDIWKDFIEHRNKLRKPMTNKAQEIVIAKLTHLKEKGFNPRHLIITAIERGWQTVFEPKEA